MSSQPTDKRQFDLDHKILRTVTRTIEENALVQPGDSILVAVSGGADSVALIHILCALAPTLSVRLAIAHLNHGLRFRESERDAEFVASLAHNLKLPLFLDKIDVHDYRKRHKLSLEEAARNVRYNFLNQVAEKNNFTKIAVGHHLDDNAELVLMFLLRGSGPLGLAGMPPKRSGMPPGEDAKIIRPLIDIRRFEILDYLGQHKLQYVSDSTNTDRSYLRNRIRHDLIPELASKYNPNIVETLNRLACLTRSEEQWMETLVDAIYHSILIKPDPDLLTAQEADSVYLSIKNLADLPLAARRRVLRKAIKQVKGNLRRIAFSHIGAILNLAAKSPASGSIDLPDGIQARCDNQSMIISKNKQPMHSSDRGVSHVDEISYKYTLTKPGAVYVKEAGVQIKLTEMDIEAVADISRAGQHIAFFDINKLKFPIVVRNFKPGDRFTPLGMTGTQKVKNFFINNKIPRAQRALCPILISGGKIIWIAGHRLDHSVRLDSETSKVLKAELLLA